MDSDGFELVDEIATQLVPERWMLVGGLMVHAHARRAGVPNAGASPTTPTSSSSPVLPAAIAKLPMFSFGWGSGLYESLDDRAPTYRFTRGRQHVDLMARLTDPSRRSISDVPFCKSPDLAPH